MSNSQKNKASDVMIIMDKYLEQYSRSFKTSGNTRALQQNLIDLERDFDKKDSPYNSYYLGALKIEQARLFERQGNVNLSSKEYLSAGRAFLKGAKFFYDNSRELETLWDPLFGMAVGSYCSVLQQLEKQKKPSLAIIVYKEIASAYEYFSYFTLAGEYYEKAIDLCIDNSLPSPAVFSVIFKAIHCFVKDRKVNKASDFVDHVQQLYSGDNVSDVKKSKLLCERLQELRLYRAILNVMTFKSKEDCKQFSLANLEKEYANYFDAVTEATLNNELPTLYVLVHVPVVGVKLSEGHLELLHIHYLWVKETLESQLP